MNDFLKNNLLLISVFITGACVLIIEIAAVRVLSPHYGNTLFSVSSVLSVILAALSVGYYIGGKLADKHSSLQYFLKIILTSGLAVLGSYFLSILILPILGVVLPITTGPFISSLFLFLVPALLLGTLSPYAVKLQKLSRPEQGMGSISGVIFFWSTLGSITGSLLAGFVLIPNFGTDQIFIATGTTLFLLGFIPLISYGLKKAHLIQSASLAVILCLISVSANLQTDPNTLFQKDGIYEKITIYDGTYEDRPTRFFMQDKSSSGAMFLDTDDPTDLVYEYTKYYSLYKIFKPDVKNALVIGGGAYSIPKALSAELPNARIDVSEIEPSLFLLAKQYFKTENDPNLHNYQDDGRRLLQDSDKEYDLIFSDVYYSLFSIPTHFTTREFFSLAKEKLSTDGVFIANLIGDLSRQENSFIFSQIKTFQTVFPNSYFFAAQNPQDTILQNIVMVGHNSDDAVDLNSTLVQENSNSLISSLSEKRIDLNRFELSKYPTLTDDFAPTEYLTTKALKRNLRTKPLIDGEEILAIIDQQLRYGPRYVGSEGHKKTQEFIIAEMQEQTDEVVTQSWEYTDAKGETQELTNIIGRFDPEKQQRIIIATHYDTKRLADKDLFHKDEPVPGANDGASGVAVLVELARIIGNQYLETEAGIDLIFFDGEEGDPHQGGDYSNWKPLGSTYFASHLNDLYPNHKPLFAIAIDMICDQDLKIYKERHSLENAEALVNSFWDTAHKIDSEAFLNEVGQTVFDDHTPLNQAGIPSFLLIDFEYPAFHTTKDTLDKCSAKSLKTVTKAILSNITVE